MSDLKFNVNQIPNTTNKNIYLNINYVGTMYNGSEMFPYNNIEDALNDVTNDRNFVVIDDGYYDTIILDNFAVLTLINNISNNSKPEILQLSIRNCTDVITIENLIIDNLTISNQNCNIIFKNCFIGAIDIIDDTDGVIQFDLCKFNNLIDINNISLNQLIINISNCSFVNSSIYLNNIQAYLNILNSSDINVIHALGFLNINRCNFNDNNNEYALVSSCNALEGYINISNSTMLMSGGNMSNIMKDGTCNYNLNSFVYNVENTLNGVRDNLNVDSEQIYDHITRERIGFEGGTVKQLADAIYYAIVDLQDNGGGGGGGTTNYLVLSNKPTINGVELINNKTTEDLLIDAYTKANTDTLLANKVDKVEGKELSDNNFTDIEKTKLADLENYDDTAIRGLIDEKQDILIAGDNITIDGNTISSTASGGLSQVYHDDTLSGLGTEASPLSVDIDVPVTSVNTRVGDIVLTKTDVGLGNVDNTSDLNKPISTATQTAITALDTIVNELIENVTYTDGTFIFTKEDGSTIVIDTDLERIVVSGRYDPATESIILVLENGDEITIPVSSLIDVYVGGNTAQTQTTTTDNIITVTLRENSITENFLDSVFRQKITNIETTSNNNTTDIETLETTKQNILTAGANITIIDDVISSVGGGGTSDYTALINKPSINGVELSGNKTTAELLIDSYTEEQVDALLDTKVDKVVGKQLSTEDFTTAEKTKLADLENYDDTVLRDLIADKQDILTAGNNITIVDNVISSTGGGGGLSQVYHDSTLVGLGTEVSPLSVDIDIPVTSVNGMIGDIILSKDDVDLANVDNTSDLNKPISTATQTALDELNNTKQDILIAGDNITIDGNTISSTASGGVTDYEDLTNKPTINGVELSGNKTTAELLIDVYTEDEVDTLLSTKVDKVEGMGLSSNDFTTAEKTKLASLVNYDDTTIQAEIATKVDKVDGMGLSSNDFTDAEKTKLAGLDNYDDTAVRNLINAKQDILTAGDNITITDNVISATDTGVTDYEDLTSKPTINGVELTGNRTTAELGITLLRTAFVETLPAEGESLVLYFIPNEDDPTISDEWMWDNSGEVGKWERIGSTTIDLTPYYLKTEVDSLLDTKVDKVDGKELSDNNFTDAEQTKLANLENYNDTIIRALINTKQDILIAGDNITITDNIIATDPLKTINGETLYGNTDINFDEKYVSQTGGVIKGNLALEGTKSHSEIVPEGYTAIRSYEDFATYRTNNNAGAKSNAILMADIDMTDVTWIPINNFTNIFDGNGYKISNLTMVGSTAPTSPDNGRSQCLFRTTDTATIKNLYLDNFNYTDFGYVRGMLVGEIEDSTVENIHVTNSSFQNVDYPDNFTSIGLGGIVGQTLGNSVIKNCSSTNFSVDSGGIIGGIAGALTRDNNKIVGCYSEGNFSNGAGIAYNQGSNNTVSGCYSIVDFVSTDPELVFGISTFGMGGSENYYLNDTDYGNFAEAIRVTTIQQLNDNVDNLNVALVDEDFEYVKGVDTTTNPPVFPSESTPAVLTVNGTNIEQLLLSKQDTLISGTNIKTINGETLLGEGNILIESSVTNRVILDIDANYTLDLTTITEDTIFSILNVAVENITITLPTDSYAETNEIILASNALIELTCYRRNGSWVISISGSKTLIV